jgi:hypothetical protein
MNRGTRGFRPPVAVATIKKFGWFSSFRFGDGSLVAAGECVRRLVERAGGFDALQDDDQQSIGTP